MRKVMVFLLVITVFTFVADCASAFDYSLYPLSTISIQLGNLSSDHPMLEGRMDEKAKNILIHPLAPFSVNVEYLGQERKLSETHLECRDIMKRAFQLQKLI